MLRFCKLESVVNILVSSANSTTLFWLGITLGKSFMYNRKSRGPKIDPWGTPTTTTTTTTNNNNNNNKQQFYVS